MKQYISSASSKTFNDKPRAIQELINTALFILETFGIPIEGTARRLERMALAFLATGDIKTFNDIPKAKDLTTGFSLKTREIIQYLNQHFNETISPGSYDNIRRQDLKLLTIAGIVVQSSPNSATNDSTRGYALNPTYAELVREFGQDEWEQKVANQLKNDVTLSQKLKRERSIKKIEVFLPTGQQLVFSPGEHNTLQKAIIEEFLPRYGFGAELLYVGDSTEKYLFLEKEKLARLNFFEISHEELPDIIAYSNKKNGLYLIEAVHSSGPISEIRLLQLQKLTQNCTADIVYITAFMSRQKFKQFMSEIAWETEVWIADNPDHLVHFNGDKFLGPHSKE